MTKDKGTDFYNMGQSFYDDAFVDMAKKAKEIEESEGYFARLMFEIGAVSRIEQFGDMFIDLGMDKTDLNSTINRKSINKISGYQEEDTENLIDYDGLPVKKQLK